MLSFTYPLLLLLIPPMIVIVWWLHRRAMIQASQQTAYQFLWKNIDSTELNHSTDVNHQPRTDRKWLLRAMIVSLSLLAVANPTIEFHDSNVSEVEYSDKLDSPAEDLKITKIAVRPSLIDTNLLEGIVEIENRSINTHQAELGISGNVTIIPSENILMQAKQIAIKHFRLPKNNQSVRATLNIQNSGLSGQILLLELKNTAQYFFEFIGDCNKTLKSAVLANPLINQFNGGSPPDNSYKIYCDGVDRQKTDRNSMVFHQVSSAFHGLTGIPVWKNNLFLIDAPKFQNEQYQIIVEEPVTENRTILYLNGVDLVSKRFDENIIDVWVLLDSIFETDKTAYALLISTLLSHLLNRNMLEYIQVKKSPFEYIKTKESVSTKNLDDKSENSIITISILFIVFLLVLLDLIRYFKPANSVIASGLKNQTVSSNNE